MNMLTLRRYRHYSLRLAFAVVVVFSLLFGSTVSRQPVYYADSSDLLLASTYGGLAHPPGYPLYVWLLHTIISAFPQVPPPLLGGWFAAVCMGMVAGLLVLVLTGLVHRVFKMRLWVGSVMLLLSLWLLIPVNWTLATIPEIMPLSLVLLLGLLVSCIEPLLKLGMRPRYALSCGFFGVVGSLYHPLLIGVISLVWFTWMLFWRTSWRLWLSEWFRGFLAGLLLTGLLYFVISHQASWYSWEVPSTCFGWWQFWSRQVYTESGSAIETLSHDWSLRNVFDGIYRWGKWWSVDQRGWMLTIFAIGGFLGLALKKRIRWGLLLLIPLFMYGPGVASYLKHPASYPLAETAQWWGIALRERMFYLLPLFAVLPAAVMMSFLELLRPPFLKLARYGILVALSVCAWRIWITYNVRFSPTDNAGQIYMNQILTELPVNALLLVDDDDIFGLLYAQSVLSIRRDVVAIPVGMVLMPAWWNTYQGQLTQFGFSTNKQQFVGDVVSTALRAQRRVFLYGVDSSELEHLGVEGNPYFARPLGYTLEILSDSFKVVPAADYGLSVQVAAIKTPHVDSWFRGFRTHLGGIHAQQAYFLARMGFEDEASWHATVARDLFYREDSKRTVSSILNEGKQRFETYGSYVTH